MRRHRFGLRLDAAEKDEIHAELAAHLEDTYESFVSDGIGGSQAANRAPCLAGGWQNLQRKITLARVGWDGTTNRVAQL